jgi:hypothetical protein
MGDEFRIFEVGDNDAADALCATIGVEYVL